MTQTVQTEQGMRIVPQASPAVFQTYQIAAPVQSHWRDATCDEVDCPNRINGWRTKINEATDLGQAQAYYIRHDRSRRHTEELMPDGLTVFTFDAGQACFEPHKTRLDRPELFIVRGGDWRGNPTGREPLLHANADDWTDDFANTQDRIATLVERG